MGVAGCSASPVVIFLLFFLGSGARVASPHGVSSTETPRGSTLVCAGARAGSPTVGGAAATCGGGGGGGGGGVEDGAGGGGDGGVSSGSGRA